MTPESRSPAAQIEFLKIKLTDVLVSSYQNGGTNNGPESDGFPQDQLSLFFAKIDVLYTVDRTGETSQASFDVKGNTEE